MIKLPLKDIQNKEKVFERQYGIGRLPEKMIIRLEGARRHTGMSKKEFFLYLTNEIWEGLPSHLREKIESHGYITPKRGRPRK